MKNKKIMFSVIGGVLLGATAIATPLLLTSCSKSSQTITPFFDTIGATNGSKQDSAGYTGGLTFTPKQGSNNALVTIMPAHAGNDFYTLNLAPEYLSGMFDDGSFGTMPDIGEVTDKKIKYELVTKNQNWTFGNGTQDTSDWPTNVLKNTNAITKNEKLTIRGSITGSNGVFNFTFDTLFVKSLVTTSNFTLTGNCGADKNILNSNPTITSDHNAINVVSDMSNNKFFKLNLPTTVKANNFTGIDSSIFPENSTITYNEIQGNTSDQPFSVTKDGLITNATGINSQVSFVVKGEITSSSDASNTADIELTINIAPKVDSLLGNNFVKSVEYTSELTTPTAEDGISPEPTNWKKGGTYTISNNKITVRAPSSVSNNKFFKVSLPRKLEAGMISNLDSNYFPIGSKINYGPIYSSVDNVLTTDPSDKDNFVIKNSKEFTANRTLSINIFVYDKNGNYEKIPASIEFVI